MRRVVSAIALMLIGSVAQAHTTQNYTYDALGRLVKVVPSSGTAVCYNLDAADNRTSVVAGTACAPVGGGGGQNSPPEAVDDYLMFGQAFINTWSGDIGALANDTDPNLPNDTLTVIAVTGSPYASIYAGGLDVYFSGPLGNHVFTYTIKDSQNATSTATVDLTIYQCDPYCY